eukprot:g3996.t1
MSSTLFQNCIAYIVSDDAKQTKELREIFESHGGRRLSTLGLKSLFEGGEVATEVKEPIFVCCSHPETIKRTLQGVGHSGILSIGNSSYDRPRYATLLKLEWITDSVSCGMLIGQSPGAPSIAEYKQMRHVSDQIQEDFIEDLHGECQKTFQTNNINYNDLFDVWEDEGGDGRLQHNLDDYEYDDGEEDTEAEEMEGEEEMEIEEEEEEEEMEKEEKEGEHPLYVGKEISVLYRKKTYACTVIDIHDDGDVSVQYNLDNSLERIAADYVTERIVEEENGDKVEEEKEEEEVDMHVEEKPLPLRKRSKRERKGKKGKKKMTQYEEMQEIERKAREAVQKDTKKRKGESDGGEKTSSEGGKKTKKNTKRMLLPVRAKRTRSSPSKGMKKKMTRYEEMQEIERKAKESAQQQKKEKGKAERPKRRSRRGKGSKKKKMTQYEEMQEIERKAKEEAQQQKKEEEEEEQQQQQRQQPPKRRLGKGAIVSRKVDTSNIVSRNRKAKRTESGEESRLKKNRKSERPLPPKVKRLSRVSRASTSQLFKNGRKMTQYEELEEIKRKAKEEARAAKKEEEDNDEGEKVAGVKKGLSSTEKSVAKKRKVVRKENPELKRKRLKRNISQSRRKMTAYEEMEEIKRRAKASVQKGKKQRIKKNDVDSYEEFIDEQAKIRRKKLDKAKVKLLRQRTFELNGDENLARRSLDSTDREAVMQWSRLRWNNEEDAIVKGVITMVESGGREEDWKMLMQLLPRHKQFSFKERWNYLSSRLGKGKI